MGNRIKERVFNRLKLDSIYVFCLFSVISLIVIILCFFFSRGELLSRYFFYDTRDTGMDFFHSLEYVRGGAPYEIFNTLYPPLANLLFRGLYAFIPTSVTDNWPADFSLSIGMRGTDLDLRTYQAPMLLFIIMIIITAWLTVSMFISIIKEDSYKRANLAAICLLLSPGMLYAYERGNILFLVVPFVLFFIQFRKSESILIREIAVVALAVAAGLKLYPAFFGILLIRDKNYTLACRAIIYGILTVVLPMFVFQEGLEGIPTWLSIVLNFGNNKAMSSIGFGLANILHGINQWLEIYLGLSFAESYFSVIGYVVGIFLLLGSLFQEKEWQSILIITLAIIVFQNQAEYIFCFSCIPMVFFLKAERNLDKKNMFPFVLLLLLLIHIPFFYIRDVEYPNVLFKQSILIFLLTWSIYKSVIRIIQCLRNLCGKKANL